MSKLKKYEMPKIEITRFEVATKIMDVVFPGDNDDGEDPTIPIGGIDHISVPDLELDTSFF